MIIESPVMPPGGSTLKNVLIFRFHPAYCTFAQSSLFFSNFLETEHSVKKQARFAGAFCNPGTFFSLSEEACIHEMLHYHPELDLAPNADVDIQDLLGALARSGKPRSFFVGLASFDNILDLCNPEVVLKALKWCFPDVPFHEFRAHFADFILELASEPKGGDSLSDAIGKRAYLKGFNGVQFFSKRALTGIELGRFERDLRDLSYNDYLTFWQTVFELRDRGSNLVIFDGSYVTQSVRKYSFEHFGYKWRRWLRKKVGPREPVCYIAPGGPDLLEIDWHSLIRKVGMTRNGFCLRPVEEIEKLCRSHGGFNREEVLELCEGRRTVITWEWEDRKWSFWF